MLELELTQCEYDSGCHLVDTFQCVSLAPWVEQKIWSLTIKLMSFWKLLRYLRVERKIVISKFKVVDKSLSSSLCSIVFHLISTKIEESFHDYHLLHRLHYTCLHTFVIVERISFDVDIFPFVIVLLFHLIIIFNFCLALLEKYMIWSLLPWYGLGYPRQPSN